MESGVDSWLNVTGNGTVLDGRDEELAAVEIAVQAVILLVAVLGNSFVLLALCRQMRYRPMSRMYLFMLHLSIADLLVAAFNILPQLLWDITFRFQAGDAVCRAVKYMQVMVLYLSTYILVMMAVDRYRAICWTTHIHWNSLRLAKALVAAAWVIALLAAIPQAIIFRKMEVAPGIEDCWADFIQPWGDKAYVTWFVMTIFVVPLMVIAICYGVICYRIWTYDPPSMRPRKSKDFRGNGDGVPLQPMATEQDTGLRRNGRSPFTQAKMKTVKLTLIVVICFFVCWSPFCITQLVITYNPPKSAIDIGPVTVILLLLASLNSCTNPWIYLAFSESLLNHLRICLGLGTGRAKDNYSIGDEEPEPKPAKQARRIGNQQKMPSTKSELV